MLLKKRTNSEKKIISGKRKSQSCEKTWQDKNNFLDKKKSTSEQIISHCIQLIGRRLQSIDNFMYFPTEKQSTKWFRVFHSMTLKLVHFYMQAYFSGAATHRAGYCISLLCWGTDSYTCRWMCSRAVCYTRVFSHRSKV